MAKLELLYRMTLRILVLRIAAAKARHERVLAIAIDQNLTGRGRDVPEALARLKETLNESFREEWRELLPSYEPDPEPEYDSAFVDRTVRAVGVDQILTRKILLAEFLATAPTSRHAKLKVKPRMVYEEASAVG
jgi:hypothetical protein